MASCGKETPEKKGLNDPGAAPYGNFQNYYTFNPPGNRLGLIPTTLLQDLGLGYPGNRTTLMLDVGCNSGELSVALYKHLVLRPEDSSPHLLVRPEDSSTHLLVRPEDSSTTHLLVRPEDSSTHLLVRPEDSSTHLLVRPEDSSTHLLVRPEDSTTHLLVRPEDSSTTTHLLVRPEDSSPHLLVRPEDSSTTTHLLVRPEDSSTHLLVRPEDSSTTTHLLVRPEGSSTTTHLLGLDLDDRLIQRAQQTNPLPENVSFLSLDITKDRPGQEVLQDYLRRHACPHFHVCFCLAVTMWVHLNHGDAGLLDLLSRLASVSQHLLLEAQPWRCYRAAARRLRKLGRSDFDHYRTLQLRGDMATHAREHLETHCGMTLLENFGSTAWDRKLLLFKRK